MPKNINDYSDCYLVYNRKSTDDADNQKNSIDYQIGQGLNLAKNNNLSIAQYSEEGFCENGIIKEKHTAFKTSEISMRKDGTMEYKIERPKFQNMVKKLLNKEYKGCRTREIETAISGAALCASSSWFNSTLS